MIRVIPLISHPTSARRSLWSERLHRSVHPNLPILQCEQFGGHIRVLALAQQQCSVRHPGGVQRLASRVPHGHARGDVHGLTCGMYHHVALPLPRGGRHVLGDRTRPHPHFWCSSCDEPQVFCNLNELFLFNSNFTVAQNISFDGIIRTGLQVAECLRILIALADNPDLGSPPGTLRPPSLLPPHGRGRPMRIHSRRRAHGQIIASLHDGSRYQGLDLHDHGRALRDPLHALGDLHLRCDTLASG